jgi:uncharacterized protein
MKACQRLVPSINPAFCQYRLRIRRSGIHRFGVFAAERIPRGRKVIEYIGQRISKRGFLKKFRKMSRATRRKFAYLAQVDRYWLVDGAVGGSGAEMANHSCEPNLLQRRLHGHILLFSRRTIQKGEELTWDYHFAKDSEIVRCRCGSPNCRRAINVR